MFKKIVVLLIIASFILTGNVGLFAQSIEKELEITTYYPTPNADFERLRADTVIGSDPDYYDIGSAPGYVANCASGDCEGSADKDVKARTAGSNADYLDGISATLFAGTPVEKCWPWPILYGSGSIFAAQQSAIFLAEGHLLDCGQTSFVKGFLYFEPPIAIGVCELVSAVAALFGLGVPSEICDVLDFFEVGISGVGVCCRFDITLACADGTEIDRAYDLCHMLATMGYVPKICYDFRNTFVAQCDKDPYQEQDVKDYCNNNCDRTSGGFEWSSGWFGTCWLYMASWNCCLDNTKQMCMDNAWGGSDKTECPSGGNNCYGCSADDCYDHQYKKPCKNHGYHCYNRAPHSAFCSTQCPNYCDECAGGPSAATSCP